MVKYGITLSDIEDDEKITCYEFPIKQKQYRQLFSQCYMNMFGNKKYQELHWYPYINEVRMTSLEYLEFKPFFDFYFSQYKKEKAKIHKNFLHAFVIKHDLF